jgi:hypothetical protein
MRQNKIKGKLKEIGSWRGERNEPGFGAVLWITSGPGAWQYGMNLNPVLLNRYLCGCDCVV